MRFLNIYLSIKHTLLPTFPVELPLFIVLYRIITPCPIIKCEVRGSYADYKLMCFAKFCVRCSTIPVSSKYLGA